MKNKYFFKKETKKEKEVRYSKLFISQLNEQKSWNYKISPNNDEKNIPEVDIYARSNSLEKLKIQVKTIDKDYQLNVVFREKESRVSTDKIGSSSVMCRDLDTEGWTEKTITECVRKYELNVRKNMVLLLCAEHGTRFAQSYINQRFGKYLNSDFKAIYLVIPKDMVDVRQVVGIKPLSFK